MRIAEALQSSEITSADAAVLLAALLQRDRGWLLAHAEDAIPNAWRRRWLEWCERRKNGEPVSYIIGVRAFYGRMFHVDSRVHIPRPSTENLISLVLETLKNPQDAIRELETDTIGVAYVFRNIPKDVTLVDIGTGSGCIAITLALECPDHRVIAIDQSAEALDCARENAKQLGASVEFRKGDLLEPLKNEEEEFLLVSNPPYLLDGAILRNTELRFEPKEALEAGPKGMDVITRLLKEARAHPKCVGIVLECMTEQKDML